jgi:hypothetical protein
VSGVPVIEEAVWAKVELDILAALAVQTPGHHRLIDITGLRR